MTAITLAIPAALGDGALPERLAAALGVMPDAIPAYKILKRSLDARRRGAVSFVYTLAVEAPGVPYAPPEPYRFPRDGARRTVPVIVGAGPAGLFAALCLQDAGVKCVILERGAPVQRRARAVERFWRSAALDPESNVQFGEGGAGTFSDGKLTTGLHDPRLRFILETFVRFGAPEDILYLNKPHIGTDLLRNVVRSLREHLSGCDIRFGHRLRDISVSGGALERIEVDGPAPYAMPCSHMILAPGNSARDVFRMLERRGAALAPKGFSAGVRIEHRQRDIDLAQYGAHTPGSLPPSDYKLAEHLASGRSAYTFCVCPGGYVVAAASSPGGVVTNGMSEYSRGGENCNGALLVSVTPQDYSGALGGIEFQERLERAAFEAGGGNYHAPAQLAGDFLARRPSSGFRSVRPTYLPGVRFVNLWDSLPEFICQALQEALPLMDQRVRGFAAPDAVLTAVETRSSSPVRIPREEYQSGIRGLYPCGEGAGFAGGIMSAALDGIRCAEALYRAMP